MICKHHIIIIKHNITDTNDTLAVWLHVPPGCNWSHVKSYLINVYVLGIKWTLLETKIHKKNIYKCLYYYTWTGHANSADRSGDSHTSWTTTMAWDTYTPYSHSACLQWVQGRPTHSAHSNQPSLSAMKSNVTQNHYLCNTWGTLTSHHNEITHNVHSKICQLAWSSTCA